jgi:hypothetical protein
VILRICSSILFLLLLLAPSPLNSQELFSDGFEGCHASCSVDLSCSAQPANLACVTGRLFDMQSNQPVCVLPASAAACTSSGSGGPCALSLGVYDALEFVANPMSAVPLVPAESLVDGCGRFRLSGFTKPAFGFGLVILDDAMGAPDSHVLSAGIRPMPGGAEVEQVRLYAVRNTTDQAWTTSAGSPFGGNTFAQAGTYAAIFLHAGTPVAGVALRSGSSAVSSLDYYFSDSGSGKRLEVDSSQTATGPNGSALFITGSPTQISGAGSEPEGCTWPAVLGASAPGVVVIHEFNAELAAQPGVACP